MFLEVVFMCVFDYQFSGLSFSHVSHGGCGRILAGSGTVCLPTRMHATDHTTIASIFIATIPFVSLLMTSLYTPVDVCQQLMVINSKVFSFVRQ